ncbi:MAG: ATP-binding cassette domain-containing protein [Gammaproteobacteria bacterium]|nr:ATP-binding cassette domain-containing protein [Gammaproteobacteria bacterium]
MLKFTHLSIRRGVNLLFSEANFSIHPGQRVGVTGANGTGKSSLFALIRDQLHPDEGEFYIPKEWIIAQVAQETPADERPAIEYVLDGDLELRTLERQLSEAEAAADGEQQGTLHAQLETIGGYQARARAARLLDGLGFLPQDIEQSVNHFSGGWRMRLNLAQALMCRSDLLLLDEPTNHLDLDAVIWLEDWLKIYPGTLLLISHDRDFLDSVVNQIAHIEQGGISLYPGNYSAFERIRAERLANQQSNYERQQREIAHIQSYITRFQAKATKARQAQSRIKALERMTIIAPAHVDSQFHFGFKPPKKNPNPLVRLDRCAAGYGDTPILQQVELILSPGNRIGLLGHNGAGKSTLIKLLAGELQPQSGDLEQAQDLNIGYFAQHQLEQLHPEHTPLEHLTQIAPQEREQALRNYLGGFGFAGDQADRPAAPFSGGEKARLVLALLVYQRPNLLLLDEPTNHLDLEMRHALSLALQEFAGAMVIVSHDRHLLRTCCDDLLLVNNGRIEPFQDDLDHYPRWLAENRLAGASNSTEPLTAENSATARKERKRQEAERRKLLQPLRNTMKKQEQLMERFGDEQATLEQRLADSDLYSPENKDELTRLLQQKAKVDLDLETAEVAWMEACEALEEAG